MPHSHSVSTSYTCPNCKHEFELEVWQIVDIEERPDLIERIKDGSLRKAVCNQCNSSYYFEAGILVLQKAKKPHLLFSPPSHFTKEQVQELVGYLFHTLREMVGTNWQEEWPLEEVPLVAFDLIPLAIEKGIYAAFQTMQQRQGSSDDQIPPQFKEILDQLSPELRHKFLKLLYESNNYEEFNKLLQHESDLAHTLQRINLISNNIINPDISDEIMDKIIQAIRLQEIYETKGNVKALEESIILLDSILSSPKYFRLNPEIQQRIIGQSAQCYQLRFQRYGDMEDLLRAIEQTKKAMDTLSENNPMLPVGLNNLAVMLLDRFERLGDMGSLQAAIQFTQQAVNLISQDSLDRPKYLANLAAMLSSRFARLEYMDDLQAGIQFAQQAVNLTPQDSPDLPGLLINLANKLLDRFVRLGDTDDLQTAIQYAQQAVNFTPQDSPGFPKYLINLANGLSERFARLGDINDLQTAIQYAQQAVNLTPQDSKDLPIYLKNLALKLSDRFKILENKEDLDMAQKIFGKILTQTDNLSPEEIITTSRAWGNWALERECWQEAVDAYQPGLIAVERVYKSQGNGKENNDKMKNRADMLAWIKEARSIPAKAAYAYAKLGRTEEAILTIEKGNARLLSDHLSQEHADIANPTLEKIYQAAQSSSIIYLCATPAGGMALLLLPEKDFQVLYFDHFSSEIANEYLVGPQEDPMHNCFLGAYQEWKESINSDVENEIKEHKTETWFDEIEKITAWLWKAGMGELVEYLKKYHYESCTLIPTGSLSMLPLHAAWKEDESAPTGKYYAMDDICFSYAPNILSILAAQKKKELSTNKLLLIENPNPDHMNFNIPWSTEMGKAVTEYFDDENIVHLKENTAKKDEVLSRLPSANITHFWTHGSNDPREPLDSRIILAKEEWLSLRDILDMNLSETRLLILSACETGMIGWKHIDEVVSLPTGLLQAGVPGVIASMWTVSTFSTLMLFSQFYEYWKAGKGMNAQEAFWKAQKWLRDTPNSEKKDLYKFIREKAIKDGLMIPPEGADAAYLEMIFEEDDKRSFEHPFYWAAFGYYGV